MARQEWRVCEVRGVSTTGSKHGQQTASGISHFRLHRPTVVHACAHVGTVVTLADNVGDVAQRWVRVQWL